MDAKSLRLSFACRSVAAVFLVFWSVVAFAVNTSTRTYLLEMEGKKIRFEDVPGRYDEATPAVLDVFPLEVVKISACGSILKAIRLDASKGDERGLLYVSEKDKEVILVDLIKGDYPEYPLEGLVAVDLDSDGFSEIVSFWGDEETYLLRVDKIQCSAGNVDIKREFLSDNYDNPDWHDAGAYLVKMEHVGNTTVKKEYLLDRSGKPLMDVDGNPEWGEPPGSFFIVSGKTVEFWFTGNDGTPKLGKLTCDNKDQNASSCKVTVAKKFSPKKWLKKQK